MNSNTPAPAAPSLRTPHVIRSHDPEQGTRNHMYMTPDHRAILAYFVRTPQMQMATVYLHTPGTGGIQVHDGLAELNAVPLLRQHLQEQGYALNVHPLSD